MYRPPNHQPSHELPRPDHGDPEFVAFRAQYAASLAPRAAAKAAPKKKLTRQQRLQMKKDKVAATNFRTKMRKSLGASKAAYAGKGRVEEEEEEMGESDDEDEFGADGARGGELDDDEDDFAGGSLPPPPPPSGGMAQAVVV